MIIIRETKSESLLKDLRKLTVDQFKLFKGTNFGLFEGKNNADEPIVIVGYDDQNWIQLLYDVFDEVWYIVKGDINWGRVKSNYKEIEMSQVIPSILNAMKKEHDIKPTFLDEGLQLEEKCYLWLIKQLNKLSKKYK
jgi:hypothetical protein